MIHSLYVGHFDRNALANMRRVVIKPLEPEAIDYAAAKCGATRDGGNILLDGRKIERKDGWLLCPWKTPDLNIHVVDFIRILHGMTGCVVYEHLATGEVNVESLVPTEQ